LEIEEVERRRRLVEEVGGEVEDMREELLKTVAGAQRRNQGANRQSLPSPSVFDEQKPDGDDYAAFEQQQQVEMMHEQDEALDGVFKIVGNLRQQADDMGRELEEQGELLDDVDTLADRVGGKLQNGIKRVGWVIKKNEGKHGISQRPSTLIIDKTYKTAIDMANSRVSRYHVELLYNLADLRTHTTSDPRPCPLGLLLET